MRFRLTVIFLWVSIFTIGAQTLNQARTWFLNGEYKKALPVLEKETKAKPRDAGLNFWLGASLVETGDYKRAVRYLNYARFRKIQNATFYIAKYHLANGSPDSCLIYIDEFLNNKKIDESYLTRAEALKSMAQTGLENLQRVEDICFIDSVLINKSRLYDILKLSPEAGRVFHASDSMDKIASIAGFAFYPERNDRVYFSDLSKGKRFDIFVKHRLLSSWDEAEVLHESVNSEHNEINPFFLQDGMTLYFASDRPEGLGKYDIYVTRLNTSSNTFLLPERLNMPFNSPANDYFLIIDETARRGYLATDRNSPKDKVTIYTFIPADEKVFLKDKSVDELKKFAGISSIKTTWEGKNVDSLKSVRRNIVKTTVVAESESGFAFFINDDFTYNKIGDFKSKEAAEAFKEYKKNKDRFDYLGIELQNKRELYSTQQGDERDITGREILILENEYFDIQKKIPLLEIKVRNLELTSISK